MQAHHPNGLPKQSAWLERATAYTDGRRAAGSILALACCSCWTIRSEPDSLATLLPGQMQTILERWVGHSHAQIALSANAPPAAASST